MLGRTTGPYFMQDKDAIHMQEHHRRTKKSDFVVSFWIINTILPTVKMSKVLKCRSLQPDMQIEKIFRSTYAPEQQQQQQQW